MQILIRNRATDLDARMHDGTTPLILAARLAVEGMVEELINCHADVNAIDDFGMTITLPYLIHSLVCGIHYQSKFWKCYLCFLSLKSF